MLSQVDRMQVPDHLLLRLGVGAVGDRGDAGARTRTSCRRRRDRPEPSPPTHSPDARQLGHQQRVDVGHEFGRAQIPLDPRKGPGKPRGSGRSATCTSWSDSSSPESMSVALNERRRPSVEADRRVLDILLDATARSFRRNIHGRDRDADAPALSPHARRQASIRNHSAHSPPAAPPSRAAALTSGVERDLDEAPARSIEVERDEHGEAHEGSRDNGITPAEHGEVQGEHAHRGTRRSTRARRRALVHGCRARDPGRLCVEHLVEQLSVSRHAGVESHRGPRRPRPRADARCPRSPRLRPSVASLARDGARDVDALVGEPLEAVERLRTHGFGQRLRTQVRRADRVRLRDHRGSTRFVTADREAQPERQHKAHEDRAVPPASRRTPRAACRIDAADRPMIRADGRPDHQRQDDQRRRDRVQVEEHHGGRFVPPASSASPMVCHRVPDDASSVPDERRPHPAGRSDNTQRVPDSADVRSAR